MSTEHGVGELAAALEHVAAGHRVADLQQATGVLIKAYRCGTALPEDLLGTDLAVTAYALYRMPATYAATRAVLAAAPGLSPASVLDVGGGTGAGLWAAAHTFPSIERATALDRSAHALDLGRRLAATGPPPLPTARWQRAHLDAPTVSLPAADLAALAYVLAELDAARRRALVAAAMTAAGTIAVVEPGTPAGHQRVLQARAQVIEAGWRVLAPCPHQHTCPLAAGSTWCHFATRLPRSSTHRQLKAATLGHEDEKFSYLLATTEPAPPGPARVISRPRQRSGLVEFDVCTPTHGIEHTRVSKKQGPRYRAARDLSWGNTWDTEP